MSEVTGFEHPSKIRALIAPVLIGAALLASCTEQEAMHTPDAWEITTPTVDTAAPALGGESDACAEPDASIAPFSVDAKLSRDYENTYSQGNRKYANAEPLTEGETLELLTDIQDQFGITLTFPEEPREDALYNFGPIDNDTEVRKAAITSSIGGVAEALTLFSPEVIKALNLKEIAYVDGITRKPSYDGYGIDTAGGLYDPTTNTIYIDVANFGKSGVLFGDTVEVVAHELSHAIDEQLLCSGEDVDVDPQFTQFNTQPYQGYKDNGNKVDKKYTVPNPQREFASPYGASNAAEDRASMVEWLLTKRGLVLPGDPDAESPYAKKQAEIVRRLEQLTPGITKFLELKTLSLRQANDYHRYYDGYYGLDNELDTAIQSAAFPNEILTSVEFGRRAIDEQVPLEILANGSLEITQPYGSEKFVVDNPIVYRSADGTIVGVLYTDGSSIGVNPGEDPESNFQSHFYDTTRMKLVFDGDAGLFVKGPVQVSYELDMLDSGTVFAATHLAIEGIQVKDKYYDAGKK